jgi:hypothetical protein
MFMAVFCVVGTVFLLNVPQRIEADTQADNSLTPEQLAAVLLIIQRQPPWQQVCFTINGTEQCTTEYQTYEDPEWIQNPINPDQIFLKSLDLNWAIECGDELITEPNTGCIINNVYIGITQEGLVFTNNTST